MQGGASYRLGLAVTVALSVAACGGGQRQDASEPSGNFPVQASASFPASQHIASHSQLAVTVHNAGNKAIPNVAVTICNASCTSTAPGEGTSSVMFANQNGESFLAHSQIPVWIVDRPPDVQPACKFSCQNGGEGGAASANANTWSMGRLAAGRTVTFVWKVTALEPGQYTLAWEVGAGLAGKAHAIAASGSTTAGAIPVSISAAPVKTYVNNAGQIVDKPQ